MPRVAGVAVSLGTLRRLARRAGYAWKRMRRSLKSRRDAVLFGFFQQELHALHALHAAGAMRVVYADECRFSRQAPVALPAERGGGGYSMLGLWQAKAPSQPLTSYLVPGALTADVFVADLDEYAASCTGPTVLVLDNASIHRAAWAAQGLRLQFLPAYCPELNTIELLWHRCKHYWLTLDDYHLQQILRNKLDDLLPRIEKGVYDYSLLTT